MKKLKQLLLCVLMIFLASPVVLSDTTLIELYGVKLVDQSYDGEDYNLYAMLNRHLGLTGDEAYSNSNDLFNERGIDPTTQWITNGSSLLHAFNMSIFGHQINVLDEASNELCRLYDQGINYVEGNVYDLADGINLDFMMLPFLKPDSSNDDGVNYNYIYPAWSSDPLENLDSGNIHMIAIDVTDLYNAKKNTAFESVYMFGWEDLSGDSSGSYGIADFDYNDMVIFMTNLTPTSATPEPASMLIFLAGGGLVSALRLRRKKKQS
ncbi:MAG: PEP-CTERM sorting domain-containing protein [Planctomycetaceae bacterium]|jgi:hypothetical protein|nr:PEP-CTERM sorting domain-containing protein [Planctomycetaceae bacterium]